MLTTHRTDLEETTVYYLDDRDVIVDIKGAWNAFAHRNGGILLADDVVGERLFRYVTGEPTKMYLSTVLEGVRTLRRASVRAYRCDSPGTKRFMEMSVVPESSELVRMEHRCLRVESRDPAVSLEYRPGMRAVRCCSICNRIESGGEWIEAGTQARGPGRLHMDVAYEVCGNCLTVVDRPT